MINIILNPRSGEGKKKKLFARALARFEERGQEVRVFETEKAGQAACSRTICRRRAATSSSSAATVRSTRSSTAFRILKTAPSG